LRALPESGDVPEMPGWRWLHTPGHTPGHVSLWRDADRLLVAGDAFVTTKQESAYAVAVQKPVVSGPPRYYTPDWEAAKTSVRTLAVLSPKRVVTGHGRALGGPGLRGALERLARDFERLAVPEHGRYVGRPARADASGTRYVPPKPSQSSQSGPGAVALGALMTLAGGWLVYQGVSGRAERGRTRGRAAPGTPALDVARSITVGGSADQLYRRWLEPRTLAQVMGHFAEVTALSDDRTRWRVHAPLGRQLEWDTQITDTRPGERIRWRTLEGAALPNESTVEFRAAPDDRGTVVTLHLRFDPPGGAFGAAAKLFEAPTETLVNKALRRFKSLAETGEIPSLERNPSGRGRGDAV